MKSVNEMYDFAGRSFVATGATGVLGAAIIKAIASCGANVGVVSRDRARAQALIDKLDKPKGKCIALAADVLDKPALEKAAEEAEKAFGRIDGLFNGAGGNSPKATTSSEQSFFQIPEEGLKYVSDVNLHGTVLSSQVFGKIMAKQKEGMILNVTSMSGFRPLTRVGSYSAAKAAVINFTQWLAVHMAQEYSPRIRVNAIAPGFFLTEQNRFLLRDKATGDLTARGKKILDHTPMARFGAPEDLVGAVLWLFSPASEFVTGIVVPVDGGFSAYSGV